jgi:ferrous iron transport protein A
MNDRLTALATGEQGKGKAIRAGRQATKRLYEMGFNTGALVKVVKNDAGPVIVNIKGNKIALGRGLASKVELSSE